MNGLAMSFYSLLAMIKPQVRTSISRSLELQVIRLTFAQMSQEGDYRSDSIDHLSNQQFRSHTDDYLCSSDGMDFCTSQHSSESNDESFNLCLSSCSSDDDSLPSPKDDNPSNVSMHEMLPQTEIKNLIRYLFLA